MKLKMSVYTNNCFNVSVTLNDIARLNSRYREISQYDKVIQW